jgi:tetratricopeptide (TPR) repeat protein
LFVDQPVDLRLRLDGDGGQRTIDGFEFGPEEVTVSDAGRYQLAIESVAPSPKQTIRISARAISSEASRSWREAEDAATGAKASGKLADIRAERELWLRLGGMPAVDRTYIEEGEVLVGEAELATALELFERALTSCRARTDLPCSAAAANDGGWTAQQLGDFDRALALLTEAVGYWRSLDDAKHEGKTLSNLGLLFRQTGDYRKAISYYDQAGELLRTRDRAANATVINNLGVCYQYLAEYDRAKHNFETALQELGPAPGSREAIRFRLNLGRNYLLAGNPSRARTMLDQVVQEAAALKDVSARADALDSLGQVLLALELAPDARRTLEEALGLHRSIGGSRKTFTMRRKPRNFWETRTLPGNTY